MELTFWQSIGLIIVVAVAYFIYKRWRRRNGRR